ncbi:Subunit of the glycosylphosphatidylinositol transamidase complex-like protein [Acarospora aff. strigata]|nr:Subunit of the glycosylphosphatidylinositol transamidase complex-like protein [Acarospora aff. strigata]
MSIDVRPICPAEGDGCIVEMEQTVDMVLDIERSKRQRGQLWRLFLWSTVLTVIDNPIPRPVPTEELLCDTSKPYASNEACYPLDITYEQSWSLSEVFGRPIKGSCPLTEGDGADSETVCINVPNEREIYTSAGAVERKLSDGSSRCYKLPTNEDFDMVLPQQTLSTPPPIAQPLLYAERSFTGHGQERGGVQTLLTNPSHTSPVEFIYLESLPWFMKPYLHTLQARITDHTQPPHRPPFSSPSSSEIIKETYYRPALDRRRGTQLELRITVPPASTVTLTYDFDKAILRYTEYPPDANRGFDVAPAIIRLLSFPSNTTDAKANADGSAANIYIRTTSLLLPLPTPDFSMPYNVIILTSTVMALAFGNVFNLLVRRFVGADEVEGWDLRTVKGMVVGKVKGRVVGWVGGRVVRLRDRVLGKWRGKVE